MSTLGTDRLPNKPLGNTGYHVTFSSDGNVDKSREVEANNNSQSGLTTNKVCNPNGMCRVSASFTRYNDEACTGSLACDNLSGNPCWDYGFNVTISQGQGQQSSMRTLDICREDELFTFNLTEMTSVTFQMWYIGTEEFSASCYLWCNPASNSSGAGPSYGPGGQPRPSGMADPILDAPSFLETLVTFGNPW